MISSPQEFHLSLDCSLAAGYGENGFVFQENNKLDLDFTIPRQNNESHIELWLFPDRSETPPNQVMEIQLLAIPSIRKREYVIRVLWDTNVDCVSFNLTAMSRRIFNFMIKRNLTESDLTVKMELIKAELISDTIEDSMIGSLRRDLCSSQSQRNSSVPFLVFKNYDENELALSFDDVMLEEDNYTAGVEDEMEDEEETTEEPGKENLAVERCSKVPFLVDLVEVYGDFIKAPTITDIGLCSGRCKLFLDSNLFSKHAEVKERLKLLPGGKSLRLSNYEPTCTPVQFKPLHTLISLKNSSAVIIQIPDLVVDRCACE